MEDEKEPKAANINRPDLTPAAQRALAEAEARREKSNELLEKANLPKEINGRDGPEPIRFGDWEKDGITSDF